FSCMTESFTCGYSKVTVRVADGAWIRVDRPEGIWSISSPYLLIPSSPSSCCGRRGDPITADRGAAGGRSAAAGGRFAADGGRRGGQMVDGPGVDPFARPDVGRIVHVRRVRHRLPGGRTVHNRPLFSTDSARFSTRTAPKPRFSAHGAGSPSDDERD